MFISTKTNRIRVILLILVLGFILSAFKNPNYIHIDSLNYDKFSTAEDQAMFFQMQSLIALDQLGYYDIDIERVDVGNYSIPYYSDVPEYFKIDLQNLSNRIAAKNQAIRGLSNFRIAEVSQLVPRSGYNKVTEDVLALVVLNAVDANQNKVDWAASVVVKLDNWATLAYNVNPNLKTDTQAKGLNSKLFVSADTIQNRLNLEEYWSTRRIVSDKVYSELTNAKTALSTQAIFSSLDITSLPLVTVGHFEEPQIINVD